MGDLDLEALERRVHDAVVEDARGILLSPGAVTLALARLRKAERERDDLRRDLASETFQRRELTRERDEARAALADEVEQTDKWNRLWIKADDELARLRRIEEAARGLLDMPCEYGPRCEDCRACRLRAALEEKSDGK